ncbi:PHP domain-containing protein [Lapillicoccus sp.]|uniref:PHP domain-containing protein n=1 Tax=Lapillicoccus sp. TaxID=1909287 RepID=UPI0032671B76
MRIDLHTHSRASDGTQTPAQVVAAAADAGLDVVALTDHDTTSGWVEAADAAASLGVGLVRGVEISCAHRGASVHLLGYLVDPAHPGLVAEFARARESRVTRLAAMVELMAADGIPISYEQVRAQVPDGATEGRPHIADALVQAGVVADRNEAFSRYLANTSRYYVRHYAPDAVDAVRLVVAAGGVAVHAHPFSGTRGRRVGDDLVERMAEAGLAGLEVDHRDHSPEARARARALAGRLGLVTTGSSDYHGAGKDNRLGENLTSPEVLAAIEERSSGLTPVLH